MSTSARRLRTLRLAAGYGAVASALPYFVLKLIWLGGGTLGVADLRMMRDTSLVALNALTAGMDLVGIFLALAFTHDWGRRIPGWILLPPMWVATGLLATFVVGVPIVGLLSAIAPDSLPAVTGGPVAGWVYVLVYIEFAGLGAGLMTAFLLHARTRWTDAFQPPTRAFAFGATHSVQVVLVNAAAPVTVAVGGLYLSWAFGSTVGLAGSAAARRTIIGSVIYSIDGVLIMAAAAGALMIVHRIGDRLPAWVPVSLAFAGSGSMFGWGLWQTINVLGETALLRTAEGRAFVNLVGLVRLIVGLVLGAVTLVALAERGRPLKDEGLNNVF